MRLPWSSKPRRARHKPIVQESFVGREAVLAALDRHLQAAREGATQYVALVGSSGIGKSALLTEFALMRRAAPEVFMVQLHAGDWLLEQEFYVHLFDALRTQSEKVLQTLFNETKRLRKVLSVQWDETEFCHVLTSADWVQLQDQPRDDARRVGGRSDPLRRLLTAVRQHPWAVGAATMLDTVTREVTRKGIRESGVQRWASLLHAMQSRRLPDGAVLVLVIDQLAAGLPANADAMQRWTHHWRAFVEITHEHMLPFLVVWAGTPDSLQPLQQAVSEAVPLSVYPLEGLAEEEYQQLTLRLQRRLPRPVQEPWQRLVTAHTERFRHPGSLILATTWLASIAETQKGTDDVVQSTVQADDTVFVNDLVEVITQRRPEAKVLFQQLLGVCAFLPPGKEFTVEDILPLCDFDTLDFDAVAGRVRLETLLGDCVRYGLLRYDAYDARYTTTHGLVQDVLQRLVCPDAHKRQTVARQRRLAAVVTHRVQCGDRDMLSELARLIEAEDEGEGASRLASYIVPPLRRILAWRSKDERQRMAYALGKFRSPMAVDLLMTMLSDQEGAVRSRAAQSLSDLGGFETCPALLKACRDSNSDVRWIAASALGNIEGKATVDALIELLTDEDKEVGRIAAQGLGTKGDVRAVPHLIAAVRDNYPLLRESAAVALGQLADRRALPALQGLLQDTNRLVRRSAAQALAQFSASSC